MTATRTYIRDVLRRARVPMEPLSYDVDWDDQPRRFNYYPGSWELPLPASSASAGPPLGQVLSASQPPGGAGRPYSLADLGQLLRHTYGWTDRRLALHRNDDVAAMPSYVRATWGRGTASGGGIYPLDIYLVTDGEQGLMPGIYSWSSVRHTLTHLLTGDVTGRVARALPASARPAGTYLLVAIQFWRNSFKYNSFAPHVTAMDVGTLLGSWHLWAAAEKAPLTGHLWFDEPALNHLLGLDGLNDSVALVVPLPMSEGQPAHGTHGGAVRRKPQQRSKATSEFAAVRAVQEEITSEASEQRNSDRPEVADASYRIGPRALTTHPLPEATALTMPLRTAMRRRRSSFGRFDAATPLAQADLRAVLDAALQVNHGFGVDVPPDLLGCWTAVNNVHGVPQGLYTYDAPSGSLGAVRQEKVGQFLQRSYFLRNYDLQACAAVLMMTCRPDIALDLIGPRGLRLINSMVGAATQYAYLAASGLGIGCGAALGFDNTGFAEAFGAASSEGKDPREEWPIIIIMIGHEDGRQGSFRAPLAQEVNEG